MKKRLLVSVAVVSLLGATGPALVAGPAHAASGRWAPTATLAEPTNGLPSLGPVPPGVTMDLTVGLALRDQSALHHEIASGAVLTPAQFDQRYAPTATSAAQVVAYLHRAGFSQVTVSANNVLITARGTAGAAESAFDTPLGRFRLGSRTVFANTARAQVPSFLRGVVASVLGLNDLGVMHPAAAQAQPNLAATCVVPGVGYPCTYNPQGFWKAYEATTASTGSATSVAVFAEGDLSQVTNDLRLEEAANQLPQVAVSVVATGASSADTSGADEWDLDTQYSTGMADTVNNLYVYDATSLTDSDLARSFTMFVTQGARAGVKAASASFGECEIQAYLDGSMLVDDEAFAQAAIQGQTVFASAGDTGGFCPVAPNNGVPAGLPDVNYPASSPYVVAVGGTTLITNPNGTYNNELAWLAGGGGLSLFEAAGHWQTGDGVLGSVLPTVCGLQAVTSCGRTLPDISMDADPNSGANVYVNGAPTGVGGTSLASPLALGVWARLESHVGNTLGYAAPDLYKASGTRAFHDIVLGDTGPYPATPGYDLATGIGTFNVGAAQNLIR